jgi:N-dimethylarginine dimethylaminohydrolase
MTKLHCWNDFDPLKSVILGSVFENDKIPKRYEGKDQENFVKIIEESNLELTNIQKILEEHNVKVHRPKQPKNYNSEENIFHDSALNMRDQYITYGNIFFSSYIPYPERRFTHLWMEDIYKNLINSENNNLLVNSPELNLDGGIMDEKALVDYNEFFKLTGFRNYPKNYKHVKNILKTHENFFAKNAAWDWFKTHNIQYSDKILFHGAYVLKRNDKAYIASYGKKTVGHLWFEKWLNYLNVTPIYIPKAGHIDASAVFLNNDTILINPMRFLENNPKIEYYFQDVKNIIYLPTAEWRLNLPTEFWTNDKYNPTLWVEKWKPIFDLDRREANCLPISPTKTLCNFYDKKFYDDLKNVGIEAIYVEWSHAQFLEGNLHCITCELERSY